MRIKLAISGIILAHAAMNAAAQNTFPSNGNVGIGIANPGSSLTVAGAIAGRTTNGYPQTGAGYYSLVTNNADSGNGGLTLQYLNNGVLTNGVNLVWNGNVGIGTSSPIYKLDVNGGIHSSAGFVFPDGTTQTSALSSGGATFTTFDPHLGGINITLNGADIPVINFTRWTGSGSIQQNASVGEFYNPNTSEFDFGIGTGVSTTGNQTATTNALVVTMAGNVGIGTTMPSSALEVKGNITLASGQGGSIKFPDGTQQTSAWTGVLCGGDYAEAVKAAGGKRAYEPGDVLELTSGADGDVRKAAEPYSTMVAGVFAAKPGVIGRRQSIVRDTDEVPMAMIGIVPTKVTTENGPIHHGDLLVSSSLSGYAMKGTDRNRMLGSVIGKAMGSVDSGTGVIEVLVTLQ